MKFTDWFIMACITIFSIALLIFVFMHPESEAFAACCAALPTMVGLFHWFTVKDDKTPDA